MTEEEEISGVRRWLVDISRWRPSPAQFDAAAALLPPHDRLAIARYLFNQQLLTPQVHLIHASTHALLLLVNHLHLRAGF
jgi:hypothetical protein